MTDAARKLELPKKRQGNHLGNTAAVRMPIARLHRTIRDAQAIVRRHPDNEPIQHAATALVEMCRLAVKQVS